MRHASVSIGLLFAALTTSCLFTPTDEEISDTLETELRSVSGEWTGTSTAQNPIRLDFQLQEGSNGQVSGSGTMKEESAPSPVSITVSGTFQRPTLSLIFVGMVYEGHNVQGSAQGQYTTVGGIATTLQLTGTGYSKAMTILLQEK